MKLLKQFAVILAFAFAGEILHTLLPVPIPASIYGIVLLFVALETGIVKERHIDRVADFMIEVMPIMFVPPAVGLLKSWGVIGSAWPQYLMITFVSTFVVMYAAGAVTQYIVRRGKKDRK